MSTFANNRAAGEDFIEVSPLISLFPKSLSWQLKNTFCRINESLLQLFQSLRKVT